MKKLVFLTILMFGFGLMSYSQLNKDAIGLRLGGGSVSGAEVSYLKSIGSMNRLELDLGFGGNSNYGSIALTGMFHWGWHIVEGLHWFVGPGAGIAFVAVKHGDDYVDLSLGGQVGLEYDFNTLGVPIQVSIDTRPMFRLFGEYSGFGWGAALGVRYTF